MTENKFYKPVGGILSAELFFASEVNTAGDLPEGKGVAVELIDDESTYEELFSASNGLVSVQHTLTLCSTTQLATDWFAADFLTRAAADGVVARIGLSSGESIVVGWSQHFGFEQPLRLRSLAFHSGSRPSETPRVELTLTSMDTTSAFDQ